MRNVVRQGDATYSLTCELYTIRLKIALNVRSLFPRLLCKWVLYENDLNEQIKELKKQYNFTSCV